MTTETTGDSIAIKTFSVHELVKKIYSGQIKLPTIQRGFVWRPYQIENLWDSVLRGYPIGAFTAGQFTPDIMEILDGQQRATALALAFDRRTDNVPEGVTRENHDGRILNANFNKWQIYIDLFKPVKDVNGDDDARQYVFRVITQAQPWGYNWGNNQNKLNSKQIHAAMQLYREKGILDEEKSYFEHDLRLFYPWSAVAPVPFRFFLQANVLKALRDTDGPAEAATLVWGHIRQWLKNTPDNNAQPESLPDILMKRLGGTDGKNIVKNAPDKDKDFFTLEDITKAVNRFVVSSKNVAIFTPPALSRPAEAQEADIEKIFVRINTGGTQITNQDLNYSLLKFHLKDEPSLKDEPGFIKKIEARCLYIMPPATFITIAFRLYQWRERDLKTLRADTLNPREFGRELTSLVEDKSDPDKKLKIKIVDDFKNFITRHFLNDDRNGESVKFEGYEPGGKVSLFTVYEKLLKFDAKENLLGFPAPLFLNFASKTPEFVLLLWSALMAKGLPESAENIKAITAAITALYFFPIHRPKSLVKIQTMLRSPLIEAKRFWSRMILERAMLPTTDSWSPPRPKVVAENLDVDGFFEGKFRFLMWNRDFLLYAQREFINEWFQKELFELDESTTPYDFDHILPYSYIDYTRDLDQKFRNLYNSIGNLRAWPYELNRSDQAEGLTKLNPFWSLDDSRQLSKEDNKKIGWWRTRPYFKNYLQEVSDADLPSKLNDYLLKASLCDVKASLYDTNFWGNSENFDINSATIKGKQDEISKAIKCRLNYIYELWFKEIEEILPNYPGPGDDYKTFFNKYFFKIIPDLKPEIYDKDSLKIGENDRFYISSQAQERLNDNGNIFFLVKVEQGCNQQPMKESTIQAMGIDHNCRYQKTHVFHFTLRSLVDCKAKTDLLLEMILALETFYPESAPESGLAREFINLLDEDFCKSLKQELANIQGQKKQLFEKIEKLFP